ncbi:MAG: 23S rRNA (adenine(1618)-N(6))-methyltransferase RlmF [Opitutaceae bacterium]
MHSKNPHAGRYDFAALIAACPDLLPFVKANPAGDQTVDFSDPAAVICLNRALLAKYYGVRNWSLPVGYLCPPIPGRADYIHHLAELIGAQRNIRVLDVGTGANCIYPILGSQSYGWKFVGTEIDPISVKSARAIAEANPCLRSKVRILQQKDRSSIFRGMIKPSDRFEITMCNPPFHDSAEAASVGSARKVANLSGKQRSGVVALNFGGQANELWCEGGEVQFIKGMIAESGAYAEQVNWFTSLVSKSQHLPELKNALASTGAVDVRVVPMEQGSKQSRFLAWRFQSEAGRE